MIWLEYWALISLSLLLTFISNPIKYQINRGDFGFCIFLSIGFPLGIVYFIYYNVDELTKQRKFWWNK